jgi:hypothetical protein
MAKGEHAAQRAIEVDDLFPAPPRELAKYLSESDEPTIAVPRGPVV